ncbi:HNH endonuclease signature motif containing protein [Lapillicoccus jejuensis]|uniref:Uncharacterized protein DUF222 n=1 Tax=Lapillicoccus jejuensis TaxID=402171 RepID=A0A542DYE0_9MICO|nr:HNH endonuclease signature motif containing protein [Lapillicoccus jejuensis]TQJ08056.1 uncharacterized protein DUF222 [Lapillicoccus jejuensis]
MDEDLTPERGAADAAAAGAGSWRRVGDVLGEAERWSAGFGKQRDGVAPGDRGDLGAERLLTDATAVAVAHLRAAADSTSTSQGCRLSTGQVLAGFADIGEARARLEVLEQVLLGEVLSRGLAAEAGFSVPDYLRQALGARAPLPEVNVVAAAVQVARATAVLADGCELGGASRDRVPGADVVRAAIFSTALPVGRAAQIVRFAQQIQPVADEEDLTTWVAGFVVGASDVLPEGSTETREAEAPGVSRGVDAKLLARHLRQAAQVVKPAKDLEDDERRARLARAFTRTDGGCSASGLASYKLTLDAEGAAIVDAAVSALSAPRRLQDGTLEPGEMSDPRSAATRRADALLDLVSRAVAAGGGDPGGSNGGGASSSGSSGSGGGGSTDGPTGGSTSGTTAAPKADAGAGTGAHSGAASGAASWAGAAFGPRPGLNDKAQLLVTIDLEALTGALDRAGITSTGEVLSPATVRRLACEAGIIPALLGTDGQVLDLGRTKRLFTPAQRLVVWRRDKHCTYPGCTVPATWCDVHHVDWWSRGGTTDRTNAALLCRRHHTHVHQHDLHATVTPTGVTWHAPPPTPPRPTPPLRR